MRQFSSLIRDQAFINGEWTSAISEETFNIKNPFNNDIISRVPNMDTRDANRAIDAASNVLV